MSVVPATVSSVATTVIALPEQATQKPSRARIFDVPRLGRVLLRRVPCRRWLWGLLWGGVELGLGFGELLEFAAVKKKRRRNRCTDRWSPRSAAPATSATRTADTAASIRWSVLIHVRLSLEPP